MPGSSSASAPRAVPRISARVLRPGAKGADVKRLQQLLVASGITAALDGTYGYATSRAVQRFQVAAALHASGVAGPATIKALRAAAGRAGQLTPAILLSATLTEAVSVVLPVFITL